VGQEKQVLVQAGRANLIDSRWLWAAQWVAERLRPAERLAWGWSRHRSALVVVGRPSACHGCAVACIGQPPPPSAAGPL